MPNPTFIKHRLANVLHISRIVTIHYLELDKDFGYAGESHDFWEMVYVDRGEIFITAKDDQHRLKQGQLVFHKPNKFHNLRSNGVVAPNVFIVTFVCNSAAMHFFRNKLMSLPVGLKGLIAAIIEESTSTFDLPCFNPWLVALRLREDAPVGGQQMIRLYLEQLLIRLMRSEAERSNATLIVHSRQSMEDHMAAAVIAYMEQHIRDRITLGDICEQMNYSKTTLCTTFKKATGLGLMAYDTKLKIDHARQLIRERQYSISQIASLLAFDNAHYFARAFKRVTHMTPTEYAKSIKAN